MADARGFDGVAQQRAHSSTTVRDSSEEQGAGVGIALGKGLLLDV